MIRIAAPASIASILAPSNACLTDSVGSLPGIANFPFGRTLHCKLQNLVDAGFTNAEAIHVATDGASRLHRLYERGSIASGMRADLLLLNSKPIEDIANTLDIDVPWAGGIWFSISAQRDQSCDPATFGV